MEVDVKRETFRIHRKSNYGNVIDCNIEKITPNAFGILAFIKKSQQHIQSHHRNKNLSTSRSNVKTGMNVNALVGGDFTELLLTRALLGLWIFHRLLEGGGGGV